ncbi:MAG: LysR family transcriptional regulator [Myxococcota bacterium]|jgi:LysR family transcriptional activator of nhaA|nr:LysR family transcriptional regulator [Myxococcota bacterium]
MAWLNYHHLQYFTAIVEAGGLAAAAKRLGVSHPTVSEQLRKLEEQLGLRLFERRGRRLELTENGRVVYGFAEQIFGMGAALLDAVEGRREGRTVVCRVGIDGVLPKLVVRRALVPMLDALGDALRLRCVEDQHDALVARVHARQLDFVLSDLPAGGRVLRSHQLGTSGLSFFAAPALAERIRRGFPKRLDEAPFLLPMPSTRVRRELERFFGLHRITPRVVAEVEDSGLLKALGEDGRGVFVMPTSVEREVRRQYGVRVVGRAPELEARLFAITASDEHPAVRALLAGI